uniref:Uncharacterized protein n=1 Tax=Anguilla anguilla TaxID=7936 RepID=A0A0E9QIN3_ANGAN
MPAAVSLCIWIPDGDTDAFCFERHSG